MAWRFEPEDIAFINLETGDRLTTDEAEDLVDELIEEFQGHADDIIDDLLDVEDPDVAAFEDKFSELVKNLFIILGILGGGLAIFQFLQTEVERAIQRQYLYLNRFAGQIYEGVSPLGSIRMRAHMYLNSARGAYWLTRDEAERRRGKTQELWLVIGDEHTCENCADAATMGYQPIGTFGQPGSGIVVRMPITLCLGLTSCRCRKMYR